ncbi:MAG: hypothetical protein ACQCXQ_13425 [Verrucomicrobiales bacterium]|nr:hypothetical protein [Verrucomicrobiota bacterium JB025]
MQNYIKTIGALAAASALVAGNAKAEVEYEIHTGYTSDYIWRGFDLGQDLIEAGVDVAGEWNGVGLSGGIWSAMYTLTDSDSLHLDTEEIDFYAEASYDLGYMTAAVGYIYYYLPDVGPFSIADTQEIYFSIAKDWGWVDSSLTYYWDIEGADNDGYTVLALSRGFEISPCVTLQLGTSFAYTFEEEDFADWNTKLALDWNFTETATISPFVAYSYNMSDDYETFTGADDNFYGGVMLSVSF